MRSLIPSRTSRGIELRRRPWDIDDLFRDLEELASSFFRRGPAFEGFGSFPAIESFARDGDLVVRADLPGIDPKDVDISVLGNVLTIKGERKEKKEAKEEDYIRREISYGSFERRMTLPEGIDADRIRAKYDNGVLEVSIPAPKGLTPKKVEVKLGAKE